MSGDANGFETGRAARAMFYCHDSYGLGHLRRTLRLSRGLRSYWPAMSQLIVTGSPLAHGFLVPDDADYVKLPSVVKRGAGNYAARSLAMPLEAIRDLRADILLGSARHFRPDVLVVDHVPAGLTGELLPTLRHLRARRPRPRFVLGLRDVVDEADAVRTAWAREGVYDLLDHVYDRILVFGDREVYDVTSAYGFSPAAAAKTRYVGYLRPETATTPAEEVRARLDVRTDRLVVAVAGGGGDGFALMRAALGAAAGCEESVQWLLVGGPLMSGAERRRLRDLVPPAVSVRLVDFLPDLVDHLAAADVIVSMGGYNAVCELLAAGKPAVVVPRTSPRKEQLIRAEILARRGLVHTIHPAELTAERLLDRVATLLRATPERPGAALHLNALASVAAELRGLLAPSPEAPRRLRHHAPVEA